MYKQLIQRMTMLKKGFVFAGFAVLLAYPLQAFSSEKAADLERGPRSWTTNPVQKRSSRNSTADTLNMDNLLADGLKGIEKIKANKVALELELAEEALSAPAIELYGENSWGNYVNPFAGQHVEIPASHEIDCNGFVMPLDGRPRLTSSYGYRRRFRRQHKGVDLALRVGDTVRAAFDGKVRIRDYEGKGYGNYVVIRHPNGLETVYGHLSRHLVQKDQIVRAGEPIGLGGSTGRSTGPHLHFETRFMGVDINPSFIIDFSEGAPWRDIYAFQYKGGRAVETFSYSNAKSYKGGDSFNTSTEQARVKAKAPSVYRIRKGDTLSGIAKRTGVSVSRLCKLNNMSTKATLRPGKTLRIK
ncbi:M23 family metallopeptidase [Porphyromonas circumdentaria]|nr:M23 family metallopeptidase [Porphyromonas circumdentaria]MDO4722839.1 M23 family metallopeptidase [Porphyromonas circumdentaria]